LKKELSVEGKKNVKNLSKNIFFFFKLNATHITFSEHKKGALKVDKKLHIKISLKENYNRKEKDLKKDSEKKDENLKIGK